LVFGPAFFSCGEFLPLGDKRKGLANLTKEILKLKRDIRHILRKKKLEVTTFRQCVTIGRQN
jgi:hypothetical protein